MKGILFKSDMHKAIRDNGKTVTRRLDHLKEINQEPDKWEYKGQDKFQDWLNKTAFIFKQLETGEEKIIKPRYQVDDVVYIKEAHAFMDYQLSGEWQGYIKVEYSLNGETRWVKKPADFTLLVISKHSPLFMPKWAARDFIQITDVRHERLQKITSYDLVAEGCPIDVNRKEEDKEVYDNELALMWYKNLWDSINPKYPWEDNPWVWRYEFKKVEK